MTLSALSQSKAARGAGSATPGARRAWSLADYDLAATLACGQAFRWDSHPEDGAWTGVIGRHWVRLRQRADGFEAETAAPVAHWCWLEDYLQTEVRLDAVIRSFPDDEPMRAATRACRGLRLLRQEPWECLASFILSSTKQIVQIRQIVARLCERYGELIPSPPGQAAAFAFPTAERLAGLTETELRDCRMGFRAPYLLQAAKAVSGAGARVDGACVTVDLAALHGQPTDAARAELMRLPGVGPKIADCVLLFAYGRPDAFPLDVWMIRALGELYFPRRRPSLQRLREFAASHFGANAGYAQQYIFHYIRSSRNRVAAAAPAGRAGEAPNRRLNSVSSS